MVMTEAERKIHVRMLSASIAGLVHRLHDEMGDGNYYRPDQIVSDALDVADAVICQLRKREGGDRP